MKDKIIKWLPLKVRKDPLPFALLLVWIGFLIYIDEDYIAITIFLGFGAFLIGVVIPLSIVIQNFKNKKFNKRFKKKILKEWF